MTEARFQLGCGKKLLTLKRLNFSASYVITWYSVPRGTLLDLQECFPLCRAYYDTCTGWPCSQACTGSQESSD